MSFVIGHKGKVLVDQFDLSAYFNNTDISWDVDPLDTTCYGNTSKTYIPGLRTATMSFSGFWDGASSVTPDPVLPNRVAQDAVVLLTFAPEGLTSSKHVYSMQGRVTNLTFNSPVDGVVTASLDVQGTEVFTNGVSLHDLTAETTTANAEEPYEFDMESTSMVPTSTPTGATVRAVGYLHVTNMTSNFHLDVKLQHSSDSTSWTDLKAFTQADAETAERITTTATLKRYSRCYWTLSSGTGSATFSVIFHTLTSAAGA